MGLSTKNAGALAPQGSQSKETVTVKFLRKTYVASLERNSVVDETAEISVIDAKQLVATERAVYADKKK